MRRFFLILSLIFSAAAATSARAAASDSQIREQIQNVLMQLHPTDTAAWWQALGPAAPAVMIAMYDQESFVYHRLRLVQALAWFDDPAATAFLEKQAQDTPDDVIRNGAIQSLGTSQGAREDDFIAGFLSSSDPHTRLIAAQTLRKAGDQKAQAYLASFLANEKAQWVKDQYNTGSLAPAPLRIVHSASQAAASSQSTISLDFVGNWKGSLLVPQFVEERGLRAYPVELALSFDSTNQHWSGALSIRAGTNSLSTRLDRAQGDARRFRAEIPEKDLKSLAAGRGGDAPQAFVLEVELLPDSYGANASPVRVLRAAIPGISSEMVLRREP